MPYSLHRLSEPEPLNGIDAIRRHCNVEHDSDDELLSLYGQAAAEIVERHTNRALAPHTRRFEWRDDVPPGLVFAPLVSVPVAAPLTYPAALRPRVHYELPGGELREVLSVRVYDPFDPASGDDLAPDQFTTDTGTVPGRVILRSPPLSGAAVRIDYRCGYASPAAVPAALRSAALLLVGYLYANRGDTPAELPLAVRRLADRFKIISY